ncbi:MAG TPA: DUF423 domain-containing protein [Usitatibacteraceae bacterium]
MPQGAQRLLRVGAALALLGVLLGAFGAHALKNSLGAEMLAIYQTGVQYQLVHALGIVLVAILAGAQPAWKHLMLAGWLMAAGVLLFSGSLYLLAITGVRILGAITPLGGICFIAAWSLLILAPSRREDSKG